MNKNTIISAVVTGLLNNRKQITRTIGNILVTVVRAVADEHLKDARDGNKYYRDIARGE